MSRSLSCGEFFGKTLRRESIAGLPMSETLYPPKLKVPRHSHNNAYMCFVRSGTYDETYGRKTRVCGPMNVVFHPPSEMHAEQIHADPVRSFNVEFPDQWLERVHMHRRVVERAADFKGGPPANLAGKLYKEFSNPDEASPLAIEGLTLELIATTSRMQERSARGAIPNWLVRTRDILHDRFLQPVTLVELAKEAGVHPVYLSQTFDKAYGSSPAEYLRRLRVEEACRLLRESPMSLGEIAKRASFGTASHFSRTFRRLTGVTPRKYRRDTTIEIAQG